MKTKSMGVIRLITINAVLILFFAILAILFHALLPAPVDIAQFDSILVKWFGFPAVATFYFILLFTQCALALRYIGLRSDLPRFQLGIRLGIAYAMIYLLGMQEIAIKGSPFSTWGLEFVKYQLIMGTGDAIPAILLCLAIAYFTLNDSARSKPILKLKVSQYIKIVAIFAIAILMVRTIGYETGLMESEIGKYPFPCYIWTGLLGIVIGCIYIIMYPLLTFKIKQYSIPLKFIAIIGVNWIIFNSFIGLIIKGAMLQMIMRSGLDVAVLFLASIVIDKYIIKLNDYQTISKSKVSRTYNITPISND